MFQALNPKSTSLKEGELNINCSELGMKHEGIWNKTTNQIERTHTQKTNKLD